MEPVWLMALPCSVLPSMLACFFLAVAGDSLAREAFYIFQMTCDLNCTAEGICWDHIICLRLWDLKLQHQFLELFLFPVTCLSVRFLFIVCMHVVTHSIFKHTDFASILTFKFDWRLSFVLFCFLIRFSNRTSLWH